MTDAAIDQALAGAYQRFTDSNPASRRQFDEQARYMPGANSRSVLFYAPFPLTIAKGEGAALWDADGHRYADFIAEYTAGVYGHSAPEIRDAVIEAKSWTVPAIFQIMRERGGVDRHEMYQVFNMGIGMVAIVARNYVAAIGKQLHARVIGRIERGKGVVQLDSAGSGRGG